MAGPTIHASVVEAALTGYIWNLEQLVGLLRRNWTVRSRLSRGELVAISALPLLTGCYSAPRFTHADVEGPAPYVFFDQKTKQMCWAGNESTKGQLVTVTIKVHGDWAETKMPVCKDLE
jgi:hypothetical protein